MQVMTFIIPSEVFDKELFVYTAHPVAPDGTNTTERNLEKIREIEEEIVKSNVAIVSPWSSLCRVTDDSVPEEREFGIKYCLDTMRMFKLVADKLGKPMELWVYGHKISGGMRQEIELARELGIPVKIKSSQIINSNIK